MSDPDDSAASLTVVGCGIRPGLHTTSEARARLARADKVLYLLAEDAPTTWLHTLNASAESLAPLYRLDRPRAEIYEDIVETILRWVRKDLDVCVAFYGHPGVFDDTGREAVRRAREEGYRARMLPGISAADCLFVDLGVDPADGLQMFDATDVLVHGRTPDVTVQMILWQISVIGGTRTTGTVDRSGLEVLSDRLAELYTGDHEVVVYEASPFPAGEPTIERCAVRDLAGANVSGLATLYVPPRSEPSPSPSARQRRASAPEAFRRTAPG